jgi:alpha-mannosidase
MVGHTMCIPDGRRLKWDFDALRQVYQQLPDNSSLGARAQWCANQIMNVFREGDLTSIPDCRKMAEQVYGEAWEKSILEESAHPRKQKGNLWGVGHW